MFDPEDWIFSSLTQPGMNVLLNRLITGSRDLNRGQCALLHSSARPLVFFPCSLSPIAIRPIVLRGRAMELAAWEAGCHPADSTWFPDLSAWLILRHCKRLRLDYPIEMQNWLWQNK